MNFFQYLALASEILSKVGQAASGTPVEIKTYIGKTHVSITVAVLP